MHSSPRSCRRSRRSHSRRDRRHAWPDLSPLAVSRPATARNGGAAWLRCPPTVRSGVGNGPGEFGCDRVASTRSRASCATWHRFRRFSRSPSVSPPPPSPRQRLQLEKCILGDRQTRSATPDHHHRQPCEVSALHNMHFRSYAPTCAADCPWRRTKVRAEIGVESTR